MSDLPPLRRECVECGNKRHASVRKRLFSRDFECIDRKKCKERREKKRENRPRFA